MTVISPARPSDDAVAGFASSAADRRGLESHWGSKPGRAVSDGVRDHIVRSSNLVSPVPTLSKQPVAVMAIRVIPEVVSPVSNSADEIWVLHGVATDHKEGGRHVVSFEYLQHTLCHVRCGAIVERQCNVRIFGRV